MKKVFIALLVVVALAALTAPAVAGQCGTGEAPCAPIKP